MPGHSSYRLCLPLTMAWALALISGIACLAQTTGPRRIDYERDIAPIFRKHCYRCHSHAAGKSRGGLMLDSKAAMLKGGDSGPALVPGKADESLLVRAISYTDADLQMPPKGKLPAAAIDIIRQWIAAGAPAPETNVSLQPRRSFAITEADRRHWAFQPIRAETPPPVAHPEWCRNVIDRFVVARLEAVGLSPVGEANRYALLRRVTYDLTGLPPTKQEIEAFISDRSPDAYTKVVDRLLASPEFGVRWAQHWLDGVRYTTDVDTTGTYRDWVVRAFNSDLPYDEFVRLQIAGDLIPAKEKDPRRVHVSGASLDGIAATGMLALAVWERVARDLAVAEIVDSQIDVVGRQILGVTLTCARCHDHKYDPFSTEDYYALAGIFFSSHISPGKLIADGRLSSDVVRIPLLNKVDAAHNRRIDGEIGRRLREIQRLAKKAGPAARLFELRRESGSLSKRIAKAKGNDKKKLSEEHKKLKARIAKLLQDQRKKRWPIEPPEVKRIAALYEEIASLERRKIRPVLAIGVKEGGVPGSNREKIGDAPIYVRGDYRKEGKIVPRRLPIIFAGERQTPLGKITKGSGRLQLAQWIASEKNPLTARVMVNRIWLHLMGRGLVATPDNFGRLGDPPSHPELLDYLAARFIAGGWSVKGLIRDIVLSSTYRRSSLAPKRLTRADPENKYYARALRRRLEYEAIRDTLLALGGWLEASGGTAKRTLFAPIRRKRIDPSRAMFDGPDPNTLVPQRATTTTTTQALFLMNNPLVLEAAEGFAKRLLEDKSCATDEERIRSAYIQLFARPVTKEELRIGRRFLERGSWPQYIQLLFCTNEFVYID